jgi:hypothetical protein
MMMQQVAQTDQLVQQLACSEPGLSGLRLHQSAYACEGRRYLGRQLAGYVWCWILYEWW